MPIRENRLPQIKHLTFIEESITELSTIKQLIATRDVLPLKKMMNDRDLVVRNGKIVPHNDEAKTELLKEITFWNQRQTAKKVLLNATYGAMLNEFFRMYDPRLGQSTTLTGRSIDRHMNAKINEIITGVYDHEGDATIYADTDSSFFSAYWMLKDHPELTSREYIIKLYDAIADETNTTFPGFMDTTFHTGLERGAIIRAGRELVASKGLFIKKKKYAVLVYDQEGARLDKDGKPGKLKVMGLDLKRSDTPKVMQQFLERLLMDLLTGTSQQQMFADIKKFRQSFKARPGWEKGSPKKVNNLSEFVSKLAASDKKGLTFGSKIKRDEKLRVNVPGHVTASLNWNQLCDINDDHYATRITDSNRIIVCKLRKNTTGMTSIAYPIDEPHLPDWFKELPFDDEAMEETIIDSKILNLVGVLDWDLTSTRIASGENLFSWA